MLLASAPIRPLPPDVAAQIKSSIAVTSLSSAVLGLLLNSLDAGARNVEITIDFRFGSCCVEDDGFGVPAAEFLETGSLGKLHRKSDQLEMSTGTKVSISRYIKI